MAGYNYRPTLIKCLQSNESLVLSEHLTETIRTGIGLTEIILTFVETDDGGRGGENKRLGEK